MKLPQKTQTASLILRGTLVVTAGHRFYDVTRHGWVTASRLHAGDRLHTLAGVTVRVEGTESHRPVISTAYNLTIGVDHTYYVDVAHTAVLVHNCNEANITDAGLDHSFDEHAPQWFGRAVFKSRDFGVWRSLIERAAQRTKVVPWSSSRTPTWAHIARIEGKYFVVQFSRATGDLVTAFAPNNAQLGAMLRLLGM